MSDIDERTCHPVSRAELERRWSAVREAMRAEKLDALVVQGSNNFTGGGGYLRWLTGIAAVGTYPQTVIFPREGDMTVVHHGDFGGEAKVSDAALPGIGRRVTTSSFPAVHYTGIYDADLAAREIDKSRFRSVALVGAGAMYHSFVSRLREQLGKLELGDATEALDRIKADKSPEDIEWIRRAAKMQDDILARTREHIRPGMKDLELMAYSQYVGQILGSETGYFLGSSAPADKPAFLRLRPQHGREIREGDVVMWQAENTGPGGFFVHLARMFVFGKAPQQLVDAFNAVKEAQQYTLGLLKPGASCREIFETYNSYMRSRGFAPERRLHCHGQGYENVERPLIRHDESMSIGGDMNIGIHPVVSNERMFMTVCDNFLVRRDGSSERLHATPSEIIEL
jgi:Xaa-Pro aminopeptidase